VRGAVTVEVIDWIVLIAVLTPVLGVYQRVERRKQRRRGTLPAEVGANRLRYPGRCRP
jgi:hypothetical protein